MLLTKDQAEVLYMTGQLPGFEVVEKGPWHDTGGLSDCFWILDHKGENYMFQIMRAIGLNSHFQFRYTLECPRVRPVEVTQTLWETI